MARKKSPGKVLWRVVRLHSTVCGRPITWRLLASNRQDDYSNPDEECHLIWRRTQKSSGLRLQKVQEVLAGYWASTRKRRWLPICSQISRHREVWVGSASYESVRYERRARASRMGRHLNLRIRNLRKKFTIENLFTNAIEISLWMIRAK
jgi:hypothetical protein